MTFRSLLPTRIPGLRSRPLYAEASLHLPHFQPVASGPASLPRCCICTTPGGLSQMVGMATLVAVEDGLARAKSHLGCADSQYLVLPLPQLEVSKHLEVAAHDSGPLCPCQ